MQSVPNDSLVTRISFCSEKIKHLRPVDILETINYRLPQPEPRFFNRGFLQVENYLEFCSCALPYSLYIWQQIQSDVIVDTYNPIYRRKKETARNKVDATEKKGRWAMQIITCNILLGENLKIFHRILLRT